MWFLRRALRLCCLFAGIGVGVSAHAQKAIELELIEAFPLIAEKPIEPSGLCVHEGRLFSVSDDTDGAIFEIILGEGEARFEVYREFTPPEDVKKPDWEGIAAGDNGVFYLLSEVTGRVLEVRADGSTRWVTPDISKDLAEAGLMRLRNAGFEGLALRPEGGFYLAAERQARGLVIVDPEGNLGIFPLNATRWGRHLPLLRLPDFAGLDVSQGQVWALFRNAGLVVSLEPTANGWSEGAVAWSYGKNLESEAYGYFESQYGHAEGLAVTDDRVYLVVDNNQSPRRSDETDLRPQLFVFKRPGGG